MFDEKEQQIPKIRCVKLHDPFHCCLKTTKDKRKSLLGFHLYPLLLVAKVVRIGAEAVL